jgi:hypothetical protein
LREDIEMKPLSEEVAQLSGRIATQAARITELERRLAALEPKPVAAPAKPPAWAGNNDLNSGAGYSGAPSVAQVLTPKEPTYPRKIDGIWRARDGSAVPDPNAAVSTAASAYAQADPKQAREVAMLDAQLDRVAPLNGSGQNPHGTR